MKNMPSQVLDLDIGSSTLPLRPSRSTVNFALPSSWTYPRRFFASTTKQKFSTPVLSELASSSNSSVYGDLATFWPFSLTLIVILPASTL